MNFLVGCLHQVADFVCERKYIESHGAFSQARDGCFPEKDTSKFLIQPIDVAAYKGHSHIVSGLGHQYRKTPPGVMNILHWAVLSMSPDTIIAAYAICVKHGIAIDETILGGFSAAAMLVEMGINGEQASHPEFQTCLKFMIEHGADLHLQTHMKTTTYDRIVQSGDTMLIDLVTNYFAPENKAELLTHALARSGMIKTIKHYIEHSSDVVWIITGAINSHIAHSLMLNPMLNNQENRDKLLNLFMVRDNLAEKNELGETPFLTAARLGASASLAALKDLGSNKVDLLATDKKGRNALHLAVIHGHYRAVKLLLAFIPELKDAFDKAGSSALKYTIGYNHFPILKLLILHEANLECVSTTKQLTALAYASKIDRHFIAQTLTDEMHKSTTRHIFQGAESLNLSCRHTSEEINKQYIDVALPGILTQMHQVYSCYPVEVYCDNLDDIFTSQGGSPPRHTPKNYIAFIKDSLKKFSADDQRSLVCYLVIINISFAHQNRFNILSYYNEVKLILDRLPQDNICYQVIRAEQIISRDISSSRSSLSYGSRKFKDFNIIKLEDALQIFTSIAKTSSSDVSALISIELTQCMHAVLGFLVRYYALETLMHEDNILIYVFTPVITGLLAMRTDLMTSLTYYPYWLDISILKSAKCLYQWLTDNKHYQMSKTVVLETQNILQMFLLLPHSDNAFKLELMVWEESLCKFLNNLELTLQPKVALAENTPTIWKKVEAQEAPKPEKASLLTKQSLSTPD